MENVYEEIQIFYLENYDRKFLLDRSTVEGYLRKKAWAGIDDQTLREAWHTIHHFILYVNYHRFPALHKLNSRDYIEFVLWLQENDAEFRLVQEEVTKLFEQLKSFCQYLYGKKIIFDVKGLEVARQAFFSDQGFAVPLVHDDLPVLDDVLENGEIVSDETANQLNFILEKLLAKIGGYYKDDDFSADFNRALSLYAGPFNHIPEAEGEEFWLGFWDYFLFDYHLIESDLIPLRFFYEKKKSVLSLDEQRILKDLLNAKFTIFYITRVVNSYLVECVNLMTDERIQLPMPDYGMHDYKKILLYGHIYSEGVVMLNYITSVQVSTNLRKRIKEEICYQHNLFLKQAPDASLNDFFSRHAVVVRHIIDILVNLAKVNVGNPFVHSVKFPVEKTERATDERLTAMLCKLAKRYKFSTHSTRLLLSLYSDFVNHSQYKGDTATMVIALFLVFATVNGMTFVKRKNLLTKLEMDEGEVDSVCDEITSTMQLKIFDPRYLTEEGFVLSLYAF